MTNHVKNTLKRRTCRKRGDEEKNQSLGEAHYGDHFSGPLLRGTSLLCVFLTKDTTLNTMDVVERHKLLCTLWNKV